MSPRFYLLWGSLFLIGILLFQLKREQLTYLHVKPDLEYDEGSERILVKINLRPSFYRLNHIRFPAKFQSRYSERCSVSVSNDSKMIFVGGECQEVTFKLKSVASIREIFSKISTPLTLLIVTSFVLALLVSANLPAGALFCFLYCIWVLLFNRFNWWILPSSALLFYVVAVIRSRVDGSFSTRSIGSLDAPSWLYLIASFALTVFFFHKASSTIFHPDEPGKIKQIQEFVSSGSISKEFFLHPLMLIKSGVILVELMAEDVTREVISKLARVPSLLAYVLTGLLIRMIGARLYGKEAGWFAVMFWFSLLLPFVTGLAIKEDMLLVLWIALNFYCLIVYRSNATKVALTLVFVSAGAALATKYTGLVTALYSFFFLVLFEFFRNGFSLKSLIRIVSFSVYGAAIIGLIFAFVNGLWFNDISRFLSGFEIESRRINMGHFNVFVYAKDYIGLFYFYENFWRYENFLPAVLFVLSLFSVWRKVSLDLAILLCLLFGYYAIAEYTSGKAFPQPHRYILPCYIFVSIIVGKAVADSSLGRVLFLLQMIISIFFKSSLALEIDTRQASYAVANSVKGSFEKVAYFGYSFPIIRPDAAYMQIERFSETLSFENQTKPALIVWNSFYCERFSRGRLRRISWSRFTQCEVFRKLGIPIAAIGDEFFAKPFFQPRVEFRIVEDYTTFVKAWNTALAFALLNNKSNN